MWIRMVVTSGKMNKDENATRWVALSPNVQGCVYQTLPFIKVFGFCFRKGEIINTEQRKSVSSECLDKKIKRKTNTFSLFMFEMV